MEDRSAYDLNFDKRKHAQYYRQENKAMVASTPLAVICPVRLMLALREHTGGSEDLFVFRGFVGRLVAKTPGRTAPGPGRIKYDQILHYSCLWFSGVMGVSVAAFRKQFAKKERKWLQHPLKSHSAKHVLGAVLMDRLFGGTVSPSPL